MERWRQEIRRAFPAARFDEPMKAHTSFRIGGPSDCYVELQNAAELESLMRLARRVKKPVLFIGWGSNLLVLDGGVRGIVVRLRGEFERVEFLEGDRVRSGAGVRLPRLVSAAAQKGLGGGEALVGVPGTVGGALVMNAGTREVEIGSLVKEVSVFDRRSLRARALEASSLHFEYRKSNLAGKIVLGCVLELKRMDKVVIMKRIRQHQQRRLKDQPIHTYNVGSTFKNPPGQFVAKLIEGAGLKGISCGGARVSPLHANFIENFSKAKAADVLKLVDLIREKVQAKFGVALELEMKVIGEA